MVLRNRRIDWQLNETNAILKVILKQVTNAEYADTKQETLLMWRKTREEQK